MVELYEKLGIYKGYKESFPWEYTSLLALDAMRLHNSVEISNSC